MSEINIKEESNQEEIVLPIPNSIQEPIDERLDNNTNCKDGIGCDDCNYCKACTDCVECDNCTHCKDCNNCYSSTNLKSSDHCEMCVECVECDNCKACENCTLCNGISGANGIIGYNIAKSKAFSMFRGGEEQIVKWFYVYVEEHKDAEFLKNTSYKPSDKLGFLVCNVSWVKERLLDGLPECIFPQEIVMRIIAEDEESKRELEEPIINEQEVEVFPMEKEVPFVQDPCDDESESEVDGYESSDVE
jgi:hypothetical protein